MKRGVILGLVGWPMKCYTKTMAPGVIHWKGRHLKVYKTKLFHKWAKKASLADSQIAQAVDEIKHGLVEARLGGGLLKKRVKASNRGKSAGYRTLLAFKVADRAIFLFGFEKNARDNISRQEEEALKRLAKIYLEMTNSDIKKAVKNNELVEVKYDG